VVQRFAELQRINQGLTVSILFVQTIQAVTGNQKCSDPFAVTPEPNPVQLTTLAQKERSSKYVRRLKAVGFQASHLLP